MPHWSRSRFALVPALLLAMALVMACGDDEPAEERFVALLGYLPNDEALRTDPFSVAMADFERLYEVRDVERPSGEFSVETEIERHIAALSQEVADERRPAPQLMLLGLPMGMLHVQVEVLRAALDVGPGDGDLWIASQVPGVQYAASIGRFDPGRSEAQLEACSDCVEPVRQEHAGLAYYDWGAVADMRDVLQGDAPVAEQFGRIAIGDGYALRSEHEDELHRLLEVQDGSQSLADHEPYRLLATEFDRLRALEVRLMTFTQDADLMAGIGEFERPDVPPGVEDAFSREALSVLQPYETMGHGWNEIDGEVVTHVVLLHEDEAAASENAERLEQRFEAFVERDLFAQMEPAFHVAVYDEIDVEVRGRLVTASLRGSDEGLFLSPIENPLFMHE